MRQPDPGRDHTADVVTIRVDDVEGRRRAQVNHYRRAAIKLLDCGGVHDAIRADLTRIIGQDADAGAHARLDIQRGISHALLT